MSRTYETGCGSGEKRVSADLRVNRTRRTAGDPLPAVEFAGGIRLAGTSLWLDAPEPAELCFLSHVPLAPDPPRHRRMLMTEATAKLYEAHHRRPPALICPFRRPFTIGDL